VINYPKAIKAFYLRVNDDGRTVAAMDLFAPRIGEIIGDSQREERLDILDRSYSGARFISMSSISRRCTASAETRRVAYSSRTTDLSFTRESNSR
jgi:hypothetical protein